MHRQKNVCRGHNIRATSLKKKICSVAVPFFLFQAKSHVRFALILQVFAQMLVTRPHTSITVLLLMNLITSYRRGKKKNALQGEAFRFSEHRESVCLIIAVSNFRPPRMTRESIFLVRL